MIKLEGQHNVTFKLILKTLTWCIPPSLFERYRSFLSGIRGVCVSRTLVPELLHLTDSKADTAQEQASREPLRGVCPREWSDRVRQERGNAVELLSKEPIPFHARRTMFPTDFNLWNVVLSEQSVITR